MTPLIRLPIAAVEASLASILRVGSGSREVALFWLGSNETLTVSTVVLPVGPGVQWGSLSVHLDEAWMLRLAELCDDLDVIVLGAVHSHPMGAFMSGIDRDAFFHAPDFVSIVVPDYGRTTIQDAPNAWAVFAGLPRNGWRAGSWGREVAVVSGQIEIIELEVRDAQGA